MAVATGMSRSFPSTSCLGLSNHRIGRHIESGLRQRLRALNLFIDDVYHEQKILKDGVIPSELIYSSKGFLKACWGLNPPRGIWCHIAGIDLVRIGDGQYYVLEDNMRCPSGVAYVLEARQVMKRTFPELFDAYRVRPVDGYPSQLWKHSGIFRIFPIRPS